jgi:hypothetical protein
MIKGKKYIYIFFFLFLNAVSSNILAEQNYDHQQITSATYSIHAYLKTIDCYILFQQASYATNSFPKISHNVQSKASLTKAMEFQLKDQYGKTYNYLFPKQKISVLIISDRKGSKQIEDWVRPLYNLYKDRIDIKGVAVVSGVPGILHGFVRIFFKRKIKFSVMMDWDGKVTKGYDYKEGTPNIFLIDKKGDIMLRLFDDANSSNLKQITLQIDSLLKK